MRYQAYNRKTGRMVQIVTEAEKLAFQSTPSTDVFRYVPIYTTPPAPRPEGVKSAPEKAEEKAEPKRQVRRKKSSKPGTNDNNK